LGKINQEEGWVGNWKNTRKNTPTGVHETAVCLKKHLRKAGLFLVSVII